jgi:hypothetical protein
MTVAQNSLCVCPEAVCPIVSALTKLLTGVWRQSTLQYSTGWMPQTGLGAQLASNLVRRGWT